MGERLQQKLLYDILRGPVFIQDSQKPLKQKYIHQTNSCLKCNSIQSVLNQPKKIIEENIIVSQDLIKSQVKKQDNEELVEQVTIKYNLQRLQVSQLKKMENIQSKLDHDTIIQSNLNLGLRVRSNYKKSIKPQSKMNQTFDNGAYGNYTSTQASPIKLSFQQNKQNEISQGDQDNSLAMSALMIMQSTKLRKDTQEWAEFKSNQPNKAINITKDFNLGRRRTKKRDTNLINITLDKNILYSSRMRQGSLNSASRQNNKPGDQQDSQIRIRDNDLYSTQSQYDIVLIDNFKDQPEVVLNYLMNGQKYCANEQEILTKWIHTLSKEQRMEVEKDQKYFAIPRNIDQTSIRNGLDQLFGVGKQRRLRPGEEALLIETIISHLEECLKNSNLITFSVSFMLNHILKSAGLEDLEDCQLCMKQLECHWKLMATRFRYSGKAIIHSKKFEKSMQIAQARGHFLDLKKKDNQLINFLLKHQVKYGLNNS